MTQITRQESDAIKGLLMILIILGHNRFFSTYFDFGAWDWLYAFHVESFFILPFFYPSKGIDAQRVKNNAVRLLYVFLVWFAIYYAVYHLMMALGIVGTADRWGSLQIPFPADIILALSTGSMAMLSKTCGFMILWFLPVMFSMNMIKGCHERYGQSKLWPWILGFGAICFIFLSDFRYCSPFESDVITVLDLVSPLGVFRALGMVTFGLLVKKLYDITENSAVKTRRGGEQHYESIWLMVFVLTTVVWFWTGSADNWLYWLLKPVLLISFFLSAYSYRSVLARSKVLRIIGKYSLPIYLIHPFICMVISPEMLPLNETDNFILALALLITSMALIAATALLGAWLISKIKIFKRFLLPSSAEELLKGR